MDSFLECMNTHPCNLEYTACFNCNKGLGDAEWEHTHPAKFVCLFPTTSCIQSTLQSNLHLQVHLHRKVVFRLTSIHELPSTPEPLGVWLFDNHVGKTTSTQAAPSISCVQPLLAAEGAGLASGRSSMPRSSWILR